MRGAHGTDHAVADVLGRLELDERSRVLSCLLAPHPHLRPHAESLAKQVLDDVDEDTVADQVVAAYRGMDVRRIGERMGRRLGWSVHHTAAQVGVTVPEAR